MSGKVNGVPRFAKPPKQIKESKKERGQSGVRLKKTLWAAGRLCWGSNHIGLCIRLQHRICYAYLKRPFLFSHGSGHGEDAIWYLRKLIGG